MHLIEVPGSLNNLFYFAFILAIALVAWAGHWGRTIGWLRYLLLILIGLSGTLCMLLGLALIVLSGSMDEVAAMQLPANMDAIGWMTFFTGFCAIPSLIPPVRKGLSKTVFPGLDVTLPAHTWALYAFLAALVITTFSITLLYNPDLIIESLRNVSLKEMASANAVMFVLLSFGAAGLWVKKSWRETAAELGLTRISWRTFGLMVGLALFFSIFIQILEAFLLPLVDPDMRENLQRVVEALGTKGDSVQQTLITAAIVGLAAGIGEEALFRGLMQPVFGILPTAILFTLIHTHYGPTVLLLELLILGIALGLVRQKINTTAAIVVHAFFDFFVIASSLIPN